MHTLCYSEILVGSKIPVISGATPQEYTKELNDLIIESKTHWIIASKFQPGNESRSPTY